MFSLTSLPRKLRSSPLVALFISALVGLLVLTLRTGGHLESIELAAYDWSVGVLPKAKGPNPRIVLIGINQDDIRKQGSWPLPDASLVQALKILLRQKARAIGVDIYRDMPVPPGREELDAILAENPHIIVAMKFGAGGIPPPPVLRDTEQAGFNDIVVDPGGVVRRALLFMDDGETFGYSFAFRIASLYLKEEGITPCPDALHPEHLRLGQATIRPLEPHDGAYVGADARGYQFLIDFKDAPSSFQTFSLSSLLSGDVDSREIHGKIVIIGVVAHDVKDFFYTPYSRHLQADEQVTGITLHAHIASQLLRFGLGESQPIKIGNELREAAWLLLWTLLGGAIGVWVRSPWRLAILTSCSLLALGLIVYLAFLGGWWIPLVAPVMGQLGSTGLATAAMSNREKRERAFLMQLFSRYVSKEVAESIWQQRDRFLDGGRPRAQKLVTTTLFSDLKGFTAIAENMDPLELIDWLNMYMETMASLVSEHGGVVDDYAGDGIKADFGIPIPRTNEDDIRQDAINAVNCALAMEKAMVGLNARWRAQNLPDVALRVGILTGPVVAGALGSSQRLKYTTVGNTVNAASRLESFDKDLFDVHCPGSPCRILVGDATMHYVKDHFDAAEIGKVRLRGLEREVAIYRVTGKRSADPDGGLKEERR